jgi:beta-glucosidase
LSYVKFAYSGLGFDKKEIHATDSVTVSVDVKNTGKMAADEVVQVYLAHLAAAGAPLHSLAGFQRVNIRPGETQTVKITVLNRELSVVNEAGAREILPGDVDVWVGGGQPVARGAEGPSGAHGTFRIMDGGTLAK